MKKNWIILRAIVGVFLVLCMMTGIVGCGEKGNSSEPEIVYGNDEDIVTDDDDTVVVQSKVSGGTTSSGSSGTAIAEYKNKNLKPAYKTDEAKKADYLESVPKNLAGQEVSILIWWSPLEYEKKKMERFTEKTGIKIKWIQTTEEEYMQRLSALKAQGNSPDLAAIMPQNYPGAILQDAFQPLTNGKLNLKDTSLYDISSMDMLKWDGKYYGAITKGTTRITMGILMFNADIFKKYGVEDPNSMWQKSLEGKGNYNWDSFVKMAQTIQSKSGKTALTAGYQGYRLVQTTGEDAVKFSGGKLTNNMTSTTYRSGYKWVTGLLMNGANKVADWALTREGFIKNQCVMLVEETWALQKGERYENVSFGIGYAPLPCPTNKTVVPSDAQLWGFPVGAKHTEAASYAFEYWNNPYFDENGHGVWVNDAAAGFVGWLWDQPKTFQISHGVFNYGGDYDFYEYNFDAASTVTENVDAVIDQYNGVVEQNLKKLYSEFEK